MLFNPISDAMSVFIDIFSALPYPLLSLFSLSVHLLFVSYLFRIFH